MYCGKYIVQTTNYQPLYIEGRKICPVTFSPRLVKVFFCIDDKKMLTANSPMVPTIYVAATVG